jgi:hypothetical protein
VITFPQTCSSPITTRASRHRPPICACAASWSAAEESIIQAVAGPPQAAATTGVTIALPVIIGSLGTVEGSKDINTDCTD